jgi:hypothetical protein
MKMTLPPMARRARAPRFPRAGGGRGAGRGDLGAQPGVRGRVRLARQGDREGSDQGSSFPNCVVSSLEIPR